MKQLKVIAVMFFLVLMCSSPKVVIGLSWFSGIILLTFSSFIIGAILGENCDDPWRTFAKMIAYAVLVALSSLIFAIGYASWQLLLYMIVGFCATIIAFITGCDTRISKYGWQSLIWSVAIPATAIIFTNHPWILGIAWLCIASCQGGTLSHLKNPKQEITKEGLILTAISVLLIFGIQPYLALQYNKAGFLMGLITSISMLVIGAINCVVASHFHDFEESCSTLNR